MKAIIEFNIDDHEDRLSHLRCIKSLDMAICLFEIQNNLKRNMEYFVDAGNGISNQELLDKLFGNFNVILEDNNVNIEELID